MKLEMGEFDNLTPEEEAVLRLAWGALQKVKASYLRAEREEIIAIIENLCKKRTGFQERVFADLLIEAIGERGK